MGNAFLIIYAISVIGCIIVCIFGIYGISGDYKAPHYDNYYVPTSMLPVISGFAVFPVINSLFLLSSIIFIINNKSKGNVPND